MAIVLERDRNGRELLWQCMECGQPFNLGWDSLCNACISKAERHKELIKAIASQKGDSRMNLGMGDKRALANLIAQSLIEQFHVWKTIDDQGVAVDEFELTNEIAKKVNEFFA